MYMDLFNLMTLAAETGLLPKYYAQPLTYVFTYLNVCTYNIKVIAMVRCII